MTGFLDMPPEPAAIVITDDSGGAVNWYMDAAKLYTAQKRRVEIHGSCRSACVLALSVPGVCVWPDAIVKAHYAYESKTGLIRFDKTEMMMDHLPPNIRLALDGKIQRHYSPAATLDYTKLRALGVSACPGSLPATPSSALALPEPKSQSSKGLVLGRAFLTIVKTAGSVATLPLRFLSGGAHSQTSKQ